MKTLISFLISLCLPLLPALGTAAGAVPLREVGIPFLRNFTPRDFGASPANMACVQDSKGLMYFANRDGVLEYDGVTWRLIPTANRTGVYSLAVDSKGRVFVGAQGELGYLAPDATGRLAFFSLKERIEPAFQQFSEVLGACATSQGVFFYTRKVLFLYSQERFTCWKADTTFHRCFSARDRFFIRQADLGLMEMKAGTLSLVADGARFAQSRVDVLLPFGENQLLIGSRDLGLFLHDGSNTVPFPSEVDGFLKKNLLYHGVVLPDGTFSMGTFHGGSVFLDRAGRWRMTINRASGLPDETVDTQFVDSQGGLWLGLDNGITRVEWPSPVSGHGEMTGLKGKTYTVLRHQGSLYVGTNSGLFQLNSGWGGKDHSAGGGPGFLPVEGLKGQNWRLLSCGERLLVGNYQGVYEVRDGHARLIRPSATSSFSLLQSRQDPRRVFIGLSEGLASIRLDGGNWTDEGKVPGLNEGGYTLAESDDGRLWLSTRVKGLARVTFKDGDRKAPVVESFTTAQGLPGNNNINVHLIGREVVFSTPVGIYRFDEGSGRFLPHPGFQALFPSGPRRLQGIREDARGRVWMDAEQEATKEHEVGCAIPDGKGGWRWQGLPRLTEANINAIWSDEDGVTWFGGADGLYRYDPGLNNSEASASPTHIRLVKQKDGTPIFWGWRGVAPDPQLPYSANALRFEFATTGFDLPSRNRYQVFLEGSDDTWSPWTPETVKEYTNLPHGSYRFRVRSRTAIGVVGPESDFRFRILPPWYRTWWGTLLLLGAGSSALALGHRARTRLLVRRNLELQARIQEATAELSDREREAQAQARNLAEAYEELQGLNGQLNGANAQLKELNEQKNLFFGIVAHDLRNPLNGIVMTAEVLDGEEELEEIWKMARQINHEGREMSNLIGRFLDIAAIESGKVRAEPSSFLIEGVARHVADRHLAPAAAKQIELRVEARAGAILADVKFTKEVLDNLISNAIKFSPPGKQVKVVLETAGEKVIISVEDQGPGLTPEDKDKLFGRFARLSAQPTAGEKSTGLGLSIVKHMVEAMEGRIWVESEPGKGASFRVELPAGTLT